MTQNNESKRVEGVLGSWLHLEGFGEISIGQDAIGGGREWFSVKLNDDRLPSAIGEGLMGGPIPWYFVFDSSFILYTAQQAIEVEVSPLGEGRVSVRYAEVAVPEGAKSLGGWTD